MEPVRATVPSLSRGLAEVLAARLGLAVGTARLELVFSEGRLVECWTHAKLGARSLPDVGAVSAEELVAELVSRTRPRPTGSAALTD
jgi:hypothetical protein